MNIEKALLVNSIVEVAIMSDQPDEDEIWGQSLIQDVYDDSFAIMVPVKNGHALYLAKGDEVEVAIWIQGARHVFVSEVIDKKKEANIILVVLKKPDQMKASERRNLVRILTLITTKYEIPANKKTSDWEQVEPSKEAVIVNLSGNGLCLLLEGPLPKGESIILGIHLETSNINMRAKILGEVVRCEKMNDQYQIGIKFENITDRQQGLIIRYVCHSLRRLIQINKDDF